MSETMFIRSHRFACQAIASKVRLSSLRGWRHHSLGMLQAELTGNIRVHIWHPSLRKFKEDELRCIHDHRFDLLSYVAHGTIFDETVKVHQLAFAENGATPGCEVEEWAGDREKLVDVYQIAHAKVQKKGGEFYSRACYERGQKLPREEGTLYCIRRLAFHASAVRDLAVTIVARSGFLREVPARVLGDSRSGIVHKGDSSLYAYLIGKADEALAQKNFEATV